MSKPAMFENIKKYTEENRLAWNDVLPKHQAGKKGYWDNFFSSPNAILQNGIELEKLNEIGIKGKSIAQLCCSNGVELLSLKMLGADRCVGFDICDKAIEEAKERANRFNVDVEYHQSDVYDIIDHFFGAFDIVYLTVGALGWLPNLELFFGKVSGLLKNGGFVFIHEIHPLTDVLNDDRDLKIHPLQVVKPYFTDTPYTNYDSLDYIGRTRDPGLKKHWFTQNLSSLIMSVIHNKMSIRYFQEYEDDISKVYPLLEAQKAKIPLSYILIGQKETVS